MNSVHKYVVSSTLKKAEWNKSTIIKGNIVDEVSKLKQQPGQQILIDGSATLVHSLMSISSLSILLSWGVASVSSKTEEIRQSYPKAYLSIDKATKASGFTMASDMLTCGLLRTLAGAKPGSKLLELGTGIGYAQCPRILHHRRYVASSQLA